jgi:uncharacterized protein (TIGR02594 family)
MRIALMDVQDIQRALADRGYDPGPIDGDVGPQTIEAVAAFQRAKGLVPDGIAGPLTIAALSADPATLPRRSEPAEPGWLTLARTDLGTVEGIGKGNNPRVVRYFADAGFAGVKDDAVAWCAAFVGAVLHRAGHKPSGSLAARPYERWGVGLAKPILGCVATKRRGNSAWQGHVGFVVGASDKQIILLGGNQNDRVSIAAFPRAEFTSFRWPSDVAVATTSQLPTSVAGAKAGVREA